jgi:hypothetical protein
VVEPEMPPEVAVMVVVPAETAVARPLVPWESLMVAAAGFDELQETEVVKSWVELLEYVPSAVNCVVVFGAMLPLAGVTVIETSVTEAELPPLHPERAKIIRSAITRYFAMLSSFYVTSVSDRVPKRDTHQNFFAYNFEFQMVPIKKMSLNRIFAS